ncbi:MAG: DUF885 domain-containing protein [Candidatus Hydrogenedentes bacterium]|nr:DUF885 domain-containing protein [Candidatus Hydrogenedentota bacterium]
MAKGPVRRALRWIGVFGLGVLAIVCVVVVNAVWFKPFSIDVFYERVFIEFVLRNPELLTDLRLLEPYGVTGHNAKLTDASPAFDEWTWEKSRRDLDTLHRYDRAALSPDRQLSYDVLEWFLDDSVRAKPFLYYTYPVNQMFGVQNDLPTFMVMKHEVHTAHEADQYIARLEKFREKFDQTIEGLALREKQGVLPPKFVLAKVFEEMAGFKAKPPNENLLYTSFKEKLDKAGVISGDEKEVLLDRAEAAIRDVVYPAYDTLAAKLTDMQSRATDDDGVWKFPDGDPFYAYALRSQTTTDMTPEQVHTLGLAEVERITAEMKGILDGLGRGGESVGETMRELQRDPQFHYADSDEGRAQCIAEYQAIIDEINGGLGDAFDLRPKVGVEVRRVPEFREKGSAGAYYEPPSLDGSRPGVFFANLRAMDEIAKWGMRTLAYHEAVPGHHFQLAIQQQVEGPTFRRVLPFTAYTEGWALYAERLAWELGFEKDPYANLGRLQAELFRAVRLVVDTGVHYKRWPRQQAIDYMIAHTGMGQQEVTAEIERYIVMPGQACAYKIGMMKILDLREKARRELGGKFALKEFHNAVIGNGSLPLEVLEQVVDRYIAARQAKG